jgi:hypothetical protein
MFVAIMEFLSLIKSSLHDIRCCDESATTTMVGGVTITTAWRALASSITCVVAPSDLNTGFANVATLEEFNTVTGLPTGNTKPNSPSDPNFIPDYISSSCPVQQTGGSTSKFSTISCHIGSKGSVEIMGINGDPTDFMRSFTPNSNQTVTLGGAAFDIRIVTNDIGGSPLACTVFVNGLAVDSTGDVTVNNVSNPFTVSVGGAPPVF